ncbi:MAG: hypothetical protein ACYCPG_08745, partial [Acidithiobacillus sp.]
MMHIRTIMVHHYSLHWLAAPSPQHLQALFFAGLQLKSRIVVYGTNRASCILPFNEKGAILMSTFTPTTHPCTGSKRSLTILAVAVLSTLALVSDTVQAAPLPMPAMTGPLQ